MACLAGDSIQRTIYQSTAFNGEKRAEIQIYTRTVNRLHFRNEFQSIEWYFFRLFVWLLEQEVQEQTICNDLEWK